MSKKMRNLVTIFALLGLITSAGGTAQANWEESFNGNAFDLTTWQFHCWPDVAGTNTATIQDGPDDNDYLAFAETTSVGASLPGSAFGGGFGVDETFTDVRVGAVMNVAGDASRNLCGLLGRTFYIIDDGSLSGAPGIIASCYVLLVDWEDGPANLVIELQKVVQLSHIMNNSEELGLALAVPGLDHARSYYVEMDIVGSGPVYVTGSLYEYKGGPLVARTATMVDTNGNDPWEDEGVNDEVFAGGISGITGFNEDPEPAGYYTTFDDVFSISDGPAAVNPSPAIGATGVSINAELSWIEAEFATSRELWLGKPGAMEKVDPAPTGTTYTTGTLEFGQTYEWRVDQIGPSGTVTGHTWSFTTAECMSVEDFDSYANTTDIMAAWIDNIATVDYISLATGDEGNNSMQFEYQNQFDPFITEATRTFTSTQDWTANNVKALSLLFFGENDNVEQPIYVKLEDAAGHSWKVEHPLTHAVESEQWNEWTVALEQFSDNAVDLSHIKKITLGFGSGTNSGQVDLDSDIVFIDEISLCPARCFNVGMVDLSGDVNGDCRIDFKDIAIMADGWLQDGLSATP